MKLSSVLTSALGVAALSQFAAPAHAVNLIDENFGTSAPDQYDITSAGAFTATTGNVDLIGEGGGYNFYTGNGKYIDLNGNTAGDISSSIFTLSSAGTLSFDYGANGAGSFDVFFGTTPLTLTPLSATQSGTFTSYSTAVAAGTGAVRFVSRTPGSGGAILDNIVLNDPTSVPEPSDLMGTVFALGSVVALKRKFGKK
jgi:hypothetical protein